MQTTLIQFESRAETKADAVARALELVHQAPRGDLILLPELWPTGAFSCSRFAADAEDLEGPTVQAFRDRARTLKTWIQIGSFVERAGANLHNTCLLIDATGAIAARYRKIHLFGQAGSQEPKFLTAGRDIVVIDTPWGRTGLSTCYDLRFPELYRRQVDLGAEVFLVSAGWPQARIEAWKLFVRARAAENQAVMLACNGAGST
ncbi:MAG TPA: nitrilase-related carbon-nitrogen hydrolase, partial [Planctomycetota bacterium]|nr:nitrilase-related carbon-nitrogen hydrolase [Planctomycetota bacterium]